MRICMDRLEDGVTEGMEICYFSGSSTGEISANLEKYKYEMVSKLYQFDTVRK